MGTRDMVFPITVCVNGHEHAHEESTFRCCPLGLQFYSKTDLEPFKILMFQLSMTEPTGQEWSERCEGIVVQSVFDPRRGEYRIWVLFSSVDPEFRERLKCTSKQARMQCPYCENF